MAGLNEHLNKLTVFYSLNTGKAKCYCQGIQTMDYFGDDREDYNYGFIIVEYDEFIVRNFNDFVVEGNELIFIQPTSSYKLR